MKTKFPIGFPLILIGLLLIVNHFWSVFASVNIWAGILLAVSGGMFWIASNSKRNRAYYIPAGILFVISLIFFITYFAGSTAIQTIWPMFILAPAFGFFLYYQSKKFKKRPFAFPINYLAIAFVLAVSMQYGGIIVFSALLIAVGLWVMLRSERSTKSA